MLQYGHFPPIFVRLKVTGLETPFVVASKFQNGPFLAIFNLLLSTQNVNVARFARTVE